ncbi:ion tolerance protein CutA [Actinoplanes sp. SE50]|uniref:divalent-cation tolerance protein CutA n=1 Tax=unclassified Actinoplanes TaxID=2626549 RepID=UPI00023EBDC2|nr:MULTISPECIES: divalent-cation tolerance protein CutA [unclassified Actinoplanes]AEV86864.1 Divalent-cation tolerance protein cutA [Actinoplanes sp. SE50/110]ATO85261.1 ion tolerance protein CutA [Actinoplanes sp. SE50]SLM02671.1 divalent-cation tolerance protein CutA [Actinoplanes sp. SE50/110]
MDSDSIGDVIEVSTATGTEQEALELAKQAVKARLAAGAQISGPAKSVFWHLGEFGVGEEWRLVLRTHASRFEPLKAMLVERHPWKNPEVLALRVAAGSSEYLVWITSTVGGAAD